MRVCRLYALHSELECCVGLSRYERGLLLGLRPALIWYRLYCFAVRIFFLGGVGGVDSVSTCGVYGFSCCDAGWLCDNLEVHSRQNILEHARPHPDVTPFLLIFIRSN